MKRVGIYSFFNQYGSKRYFAKQLEKSLRKHGVETILIDPAGGELTFEIDLKMRRFAPDITLSFNAILPSSKGFFLWDYSQIPHLSVLLDPAFYSLNLLNSPYSRISSVDLADCEWLEEEHEKKTLFWPHATEVFSNWHAEKIYDLVFLGTCTDYEGIEAEWKSSLSTKEQAFLKSAIQAMFSPPLKAFREVLKAAENLPDVRYDRLFYYLDQYVRGKDRIELIRNIKDRTVHIFGEPAWNNPVEGVSWKKYFENQKNVILHTAVPFEESFNIIRHSKICLNSSPFFKHGSHERILNGLALGSLPLTTQNGFIDQFFKPGEELLSYQIGEWKNVNELINLCLANEKKWQEMVAAGRDKVLQFHTWDNRVKELLEADFLFV